MPKTGSRRSFLRRVAREGARTKLAPFIVTLPLAQMLTGQVGLQLELLCTRKAYLKHRGPQDRKWL